MTEFLPHIVILLFAASVLAGFIDSIAGGGGLIAIPAMLLAGIPPLEALGTNKLSAQFGAASATLSYARKGHVRLAEQYPMALMAIGGGALGALAAAFVPPNYLGAIMPVMLIAIGLYFAFKPSLGDADSRRRMKPLFFGLAIVPLIGFYDGIFGPGTGSFFMLAFVLLAGFGLLKATAHTKLLNLGSNFGAFIVFVATGSILWKLGILMAIGQIIGAQIGSRLAMKNGAKLIRPLLVISCLAMATRLMIDPTNPLRLALGV